MLCGILSTLWSSQNNRFFTGKMGDPKTTICCQTWTPTMKKTGADLVPGILDTWYWNRVAHNFLNIFLKGLLFLDIPGAGTATNHHRYHSSLFFFKGHISLCTTLTQQTTQLHTARRKKRTAMNDRLGKSEWVKVSSKKYTATAREKKRWRSHFLYKWVHQTKQKYLEKRDKRQLHRVFSFFPSFQPVRTLLISTGNNNNDT